MRLALAALIALTTTAGASTAQVVTPLRAGDRILVMPFDNLKRDGRIIWLGEAASVVLTDDLAARGARPITRPQRLQAFERLQVPPSASLTDATVIRVAQLVGAERVIVGTIQLDGEALIVRARSVALEPGRVQNDVTERGALTDLYAILGRVAHRLEPSGAATTFEPQHPPVAAFESYIKGILAETPATAVNYLNAVLKQQPTFDRARLALWDVYTDEGEHDKALQAVAAVPGTSPFAGRARFRAGLSQLDLKKYDDAFATFQALVKTEPEASALNNLGVVQLRRGTAGHNGATFYFNKAAETDSGDPDYLFNLGYAYWMERDTQAAIYWLREAVRRRPADGVAHYVLGTALAASGATSEAVREKELARRLSSQYAQWDRRPPADPVPRGLERVKNDVELPHIREIEARLTTVEQRDQQELARFYLESGRRLFGQENDREAAAELNRALYNSPYLAEAHLLLGRIHLRNGRVREAIDALKISLWSAETAEAHAVLGEAYRQDKDVVNARAEADRALALDPSSSEARAVLARIQER
jgi:tetratricopeptide (TPR) repeat protein